MAGETFCVAGLDQDAYTGGLYISPTYRWKARPRSTYLRHTLARHVMVCGDVLQQPPIHSFCPCSRAIPTHSSANLDISSSLVAVPGTHSFAMGS